MRPHGIKVGDAVLLKQKQTKTKSRYDPDPFWVTGVDGTQITASREHLVRTRDAQRFKKVTIAEPKSYQRQRQPLVVHPASNSSLGLLQVQSNTGRQARAQPALNSPAVNVMPEVNVRPEVNVTPEEEIAVAHPEAQQQVRQRGRPRGSKIGLGSGEMRHREESEDR